MYNRTLVRAAILITATVLFCCLQLQVCAQTVSPAMQSADRLLEEKRYADAASAYEAILGTAPDNARAWYQLAMARYSLNQMPAAAEALLKNIGSTKNATSMFNLACVYARMNEKDKAIEWLGKAFTPGGGGFFLLNIYDPDLNSLRDDPRYKELTLTVDKTVRPCMYRPESRQFDFFIGEWDAFNRNGRKDGTSVIQQISGGCGVLENWTNAFGASGGGKSINFYDPQTEKWYEYWIGSDGNPTRYSGIYKDGALRFEGEPFTQKDGKKVLSRLTFFNVDSNTVRQLAERSDDEGKTWKTQYDYKYVRHNANSAAGVPNK